MREGRGESRALFVCAERSGLLAFREETPGAFQLGSGGRLAGDAEQLPVIRTGLFALARQLDAHLAAYRQPNYFHQG